MKRLLLVLPFLLAACDSGVTNPSRNLAPGSPSLAAAAAACTLASGKVVARGFDQFGYNRCAHQFVGSADGVDKVLDGKVWGDPTFANDHLVMKWNEEWDRGNAEGWKKPPYDAWENNEWNGVRPDGSGYTEHFKTRWSAECTAGLPPASGGTCIWGQFEVLMDQGTVPGGGHEWWVKAIPAGYGN